MSEDGKHLTFVADRDTLVLIGTLKKELKAPTTAAVFRKALAFTKLAVDESKPYGGVVTLRGKGAPENEGVSIVLTV